MIQGSDEWHQARLGKATASRIADITARTKSGWGASRANYAAELVAERLTGVPAEKFVGPAMVWGTDNEPKARELYEFVHDAQVEQVGFIDHPKIAMSGASPDGLVGARGLVEIKAPNTSTHIETLLGQNVPDRYVVQIQWQLATTGRDFCDFVSFDPRLSADMRLFVKRIERDGARIAELEREVSAFLSEVDETVRRLREMYSQKEAA